MENEILPPCYSVSDLLGRLCVVEGKIGRYGVAMGRGEKPLGAPVWLSWLEGLWGILGILKKE
jgi:hypothetical protein